MAIPQSSRSYFDVPAPIPFPLNEVRRPGRPQSNAGERVIGEFEAMSRRIDDLARELNCLGYFDDDEDRPRAA